ncbi:MAG: hypothetical protein K9N49_03735, partial [Candidatus Marinimicrobia bacterium]|nr:hypothetical protein [Candidatus Neomarinimicrobiota bacterium]
MREWTHRVKQWSGGLALAGAAILLVWTGLVARTLPPAPADQLAPPAVHNVSGWPEVTAPASNLWLVVAAGNQPLDTRSGPLAERYRLAGTFFALGDGDNDEPTRQAIIDDVQARQQSLVRENDTLAGDVVVEQVLRDHVV